MLKDDQEVEPVFEEEQMRRLVLKDKYLKFVYVDMVGKGLAEVDALRITFNSNVIGDSVYINLYENVS